MRVINDSEYAIFSISKPAIINPESNNPNGSKARPNTAVCLSPLVQYIVSGDRQSGLNVAVERTSRLTNISRLSRKTAEQTANVLVRRLTKHPVDLVKSITYDNGAENVLHEKINNALQCTSYFCEPYHSWEKGSVEQINGLIRRTFPKGTNFGEITNSEINRLEKLLNNRPRKCLNYQTPYEVFQQLRGALTG